VPNALRITLAIAGFGEDNLDVMIEENQLIIHGRLYDDKGKRVYLHRDIAGRQFLKRLVLVEGIEVYGRALAPGPARYIYLERPEPGMRSRTIAVRTQPAPPLPDAVTIENRKSEGAQ